MAMRSGCLGSRRVGIARIRKAPFRLRSFVRALPTRPEYTLCNDAWAKARQDTVFVTSLCRSPFPTLRESP
jgi:hypothetical protein